MATPPPKKNAIEKRLDELTSLWNEFAENPEARLLRWVVVDSDSARMVDLFLELQNEEASDIPDLFIRFNEPFKDPDRYGFVLRQSLLEQYEDIREGIGEEDIAADWECPEVRLEDTGLLALLRACASLRKYYDGIMVHLVAVLSPQQVEDADGWKRWLETLAESQLSTNLRFMVIERHETRVLDQLSEAHSDRIVTLQPDLDMPGAYVELVREIPGSGPGFTFRRLFIALTSAASVGNLPAAQQAGQRALKIATDQGWPQMQTVIHMALGSAFFAAGDTAAALKSYRGANEAIAGQDDPAAPKLDIQTRFAEAAMLIAEEEYEQAAEVYERIAPLAQEQEDHFALLESRRMAAYCRQQAGQYEQAWTEGHKALAAGELLDQATRADSTLSYVGQGLLQLIEERDYPKRSGDVRERMVELIGEDWEDKLVQGTAAS